MKTLLTRIKRWLSRTAATVALRTTTLPNGRVAVVDERGNFVRFK